MANIQFLNVTDNSSAFGAIGASGHIRIGAHAFDGPGGTLAHAYLPPTNGDESLGSASGDMHFDEDESWYCDAVGFTDIGLVALHEIGHSIGLRHESSDTAIMNPFYNPAVGMTGLLADDLHGVTEIYGPNSNKHTFFGNVGIGTELASASLHVKRSDGSAKVLVEDASAETAKRSLFELVNNGAIFFRFRDTSNSNQWSFSLGGTGSFQIDNPAIVGGAELVVGTDGRIRMGPAGSTFDLAANGNLTITGNLIANGVVYASDRDLKSDFQVIDSQSILKKIAALPMSSWRYTEDASGARHIGPVAQDFRDALGLGDSDKTINAVDSIGVSLAAIQGLYELIQQQQRRIETLESQLQEIVGRK